MINLQIEDIIEFSRPFYENKDPAHNFLHADKVYKLAKKIAQEVKIEHNNIYLVCGAFFHGFDKKYEQKIVDFLLKNSVQEKEISLITQVAKETHNDTAAFSNEGKILHDAHLLEGGSYSIVIKSIITGISRGWTQKRIAAYIENKVGLFQCNFPYTQKIYKKRERIALKFADQMKGYLK